MTKRQDRKIILIAYINSHLSEMIPLASFLKKKKYVPVILYLKDKGYAFEPIKNEYINLCLQKKVKIINLLGEKFVLKKSERTVEGSGKLVKIIRNSKILYPVALKFYTFFTPIIYLRWLLRWRSLANNLFVKIRPSVLILPEENQIFQSEIFSKAAQKIGANTLVYPYTIAGSVELAEALEGKTENSLRPILNRVITRLYPKWVFKYRGQELILMPAFKVFITEFLHLSMPDPWKLNAGSADLVLAGSRATEKYFIKSGLKKSRLVLTGSLSMDELTKNQSKPKEKPVLLFAFPPSQFPRKGLQFERYDELKSFLLDELSKIKNYRVIISLHPRLDPNEFKNLNKSGLELTDNSVSSLMPGCSIFVASISATIQWAIACSKPVINYDVYKYRYNDYDSAKGVVTVETKRDFIKYLKKLTTDKKFYQRLAEKQKAISGDWGMLDGKSGERIVKLIDSLCKE